VASRLAVLLLVFSALAADVSNGERPAMRWCVACHVVAGDQREANADAPPFEESPNGRISANPAS
jgi:mono/diheme cytochrome c family protein